MLTIQQAFDNIVNVVSNAKMTSQEHDALKESVQIVVKRCEVADRLEAAAKEAVEEKELPKKKIVELRKPFEVEVTENGPTNEQPIVPGTNQEDSE